MWILVSGGAGYIGSSLVKKLIQLGKNVLVVDNLCRGDIRYLKEFFYNPRFRMIVCDINDGKRLFNYLNGVELYSVVHLAAIPGLERCQNNSKRAIFTNIHGTYNLLELSKELDVERFIFSSSGAVYGIPIKVPVPEDHMLAPTNLYGKTKLAGERLLERYHKNYGLDTIILRFGNVYGVGLFTYYETVIPKFVKQALNESKLTIYGDGNQGRDFVHIDDIIEAIILFILKDIKLASIEAFNVSTGEPVSINKIANIVYSLVKERYGKEINNEYLPARRGEPSDPNFCYKVTKIKNMGFKSKWSITRGVEQIFQFLDMNKNTSEILY